MLVVIPEPVTCYSTARYHQKQVFQVSANSNLVVVDWFTSGRYECGEKWDFSIYKSVNHIFLGDQPLFIDSVQTLDLVLLACDLFVQSISVLIFYNYKHPYLKHTFMYEQVLLEQGSSFSIAEQMQEYNVIAMVVLLG